MSERAQEISMSSLKEALHLALKLRLINSAGLWFSAGLSFRLTC